MFGVDRDRVERRIRWLGPVAARTQPVDAENAGNGRALGDGFVGHGAHVADLAAPVATVGGEQCLGFGVL